MTRPAWNTPSPGSSERGLTLVELMVVLVFVAVGVLTLAVVQTRSFTNVHETGRYTEALDLAEMRMETARGLGYANAVSDSGVVDRINWRCLVDSTGAGLRRVRVLVSWQDGQLPRSLQLMTLISSR